MGRTWHEFRETLFNEAYRHNIPISGQFELTARCNLSCQMCYVNLPHRDKTGIRQELTASEWVSLAAEARDSGMLYLLLTGGEIFLRPDFRVIYEELAKMGFRMTLYTNGTLVTPKIAKWLAAMPPANVEISIYGASADTYKKVTGSAKAYEHTLRGIDSLIAEGIPVNLRTTVIAANADDHKQLADLAESRNTVLRYVFYISPRRDSDCGMRGSLRLSPQEITQYELLAGQTYSEKLKQMKMKYGLISESNIGLDIADSVHPDKGNDDYYPFKCSAGKSEFWITWDGTMTPCGTMALPAVMPLNTGFSAAWRELSSLSARVPVCDQCMKCPDKEVCWTCPARLQAETGSFAKPAPYLCEWAALRKKVL